MVKKFERKISTTQSNYKFNLERKYITQQCSYNLPNDIEAYLISKNAIVRETPIGNNRYVQYRLADEYKLVLGDSILAIIGEIYRNKANKVIFTHTEGADGSSPKMQLKKTDFASKGDDYKWFVDLYNKNIEGVNFIVFVDDVAKTLTFNVEFTCEMFSGVAEGIEVDVADDNDYVNYHFTGTAINKIFFGVPGCGKSYHIAHEILVGYEKDNIIRTTFYQDYSNTDFVGQILPKITQNEEGKDIVEYIFNPGPFTLALIQAISNPTKKVALVVEEINRGNAPAIFGDIFQLLDRDENGISEYGIINVGVLDYLNDYEFTVEGNKVRYEFKEIKIPGNMDIFATMNTSDQNVYTLDTAFTRRWEKERIPNEFKGHAIETMLVPGLPNCTWGKFVVEVNNHIKNNLETLQVNEDKQVGAFFIKERDLLTKDEIATDKKIEAFAFKVLEYLWDDVSKLDHSVIFNPIYKTFEGLVKGFIKNGATVFNDIIKVALETKTK